MGRSEEGFCHLVRGGGETLQRKGRGSWIRIKKTKKLRGSPSPKRREKLPFEWSSCVGGPVCREQRGRRGWKRGEEAGGVSG